MKIVIIDQARMTSSRLPGKVLKEVLGKPLLEYQIERLRQVKLADELVIATTTNDTDQSIVDLCERLGVSYFRGPEEDVLARYYGAATLHQADVIVRITSDCPVIDPAVVDEVIEFYLDHCRTYDYVSNGLERTYPRGMDTEVFSCRILRESNQEAIDKFDREHVTPFIYRHPERYRIKNIALFENQGHHRWTVDTVEDFELIRLIIESLYLRNSLFTMMDILDLLNDHPSWSLINAHVIQKQLEQ